MALKKEYDKDNENHIARKIILASKTIQHAFDLELRNKVGITLAQWRAINILTTENGITQREIAEKLGLDASSLIPLIDRLEIKELVKRKSDKSDRRINRLYLTNRAESLVDSMHTCALSVRKTLTRNITVDQLEATHLILNRICQNLINHYGLDINDKPVERSINNLSSKDKITLPNPKKWNSLENDISKDQFSAVTNSKGQHSHTQKSSRLSKDSDRISINAWKVLAILSLIATMVTYAETMLIPAIPDLIRNFQVSYNTSSWLMTMYLLAGAVMTPIAGKLSDIHGRKKILLLIMIIYAVGVTIAASSSTFYLMLIARGLQGVGMGMFPIAYTIIRSQFPRNKISIGQGIITSMYASGSVIGLVVGGSIIQYHGWHATFLTVIPISIALLIIIWKFVNIKDHRYEGANNYSRDIKNNDLSKDYNNREHQHKQKYNIESHVVSNKEGNIKKVPLDIKGAITLASAIVSTLLAFTFIQPQGSAISSATSFPNSYSVILTIFFFMIGVASFSAFIFIERRATSPLLDLKLMTNRTILPGNMVMLIIGMTMFLVMQTIPILARSPHPLGFGDSVIDATKIQIPFSIILLIFGPTSGFIISKMGSRTPMIAGTIITALGFFTIYAFHSTQLLLSIGLAVVSGGLSFAAVGVMNIIILATPAQSMGITTGMTSLIRIIGSAIGPAIAGMIMQSQQELLKMNGSLVLQSYPTGYTYNLIFLTATILSISSIGFAILAGKNRKYNTAPKMIQ